jgi:hypothetical protein
LSVPIPAVKSKNVLPSTSVTAAPLALAATTAVARAEAADTAASRRASTAWLNGPGSPVRISIVPILFPYRVGEQKTE